MLNDAIDKLYYVFNVHPTNITAEHYNFAKSQIEFTPLYFKLLARTLNRGNNK